MAEGVLFEFAGKVLGDLASLAYHELGLAWGAKAELSKLKDTVSLIKDGLRDVEEQQRNNNHAVTNWIGQFKDALYDVDDLLDDLSTEALRRRIMSGNEMVKEVRIFFSKSNQLAYSLKMGHRVKALRERLKKIAADKTDFHFTDGPVELPIALKERDQTHSFVRPENVIGRDEDKKKIVGLLLDPNPEEDVSVVPTIGMGGLGKTTLAKLVFNDENIVKHFELKMWVCVSEEFEVKVIVEKIIEAATGSKPERDLGMDSLQKRLRLSINGKKYLLVLDDVWNENLQKWSDLRDLLLDGARGSWIVITTRGESVAQITGTVSPHVLKGLSDSQSWALLKQMAFKKQSQESDNSCLEAIGMEIVEKCNGVPLALRAIGGVLVKIRRTESEWSKVKKNVLKYITQEETGIMPILKLSYDHLPPHLRQCFAYCSLIPKDTEVSVQELVILWMAQGFIEPSSGDEDLEDVGQKYFMDLLWGSFFQVAEEDDSGNVETFTMHDLMHDLACSVAGTECCIARLGAQEVKERTRHVFFEGLDTSWKIPSTLLKAHRLRTFLGDASGRLNLSTCSELMSSLKCLRVLELSDLRAKTLPHSIGELKHLRALYLSYNHFIKKLPNSLCRLHNLQMLFLSGCRTLEKLPRKTRRLVSLMYLRIDDCDDLAYMPRGLGKLTSLRTLDKFVVGKTGRHVGQLRELNGLNELKGELHISSLENAIPEPRSSFLKEKLSLKSLILSWGEKHVDMEDDEIVLECLQPYPKLEKLQVYKYPGSKIPSWLSFISNLTKLSLEDCVECKHLPPLHQLCSLKVLSLTKLKALENVSENEMQEDLSSEKSATIFPSLEVLKLEDCPNLKGWWRGDVGEASNAQSPCFPRLSELDIRDCPNLISMPLFPSVKDVRLEKTSWKPLQQTMRLKMTTSEAPSSSSSSPLFPPFCKLEELMLKEIEDLDSLLDEFLQNLTSLQSLCIEGCINLTSMVEKMHSLTSVTNSKSTTILPSLEALKLQDCPNLKGWWRGDVGEASNAQSPCFPYLSKLDIQRCPNLISMPLFPSVKKVYLSNTSGKPLQQTTRLKKTTSEAPSSSSSSPLIPPFCKLENLVLHKIEDLDSLPDEFLQNLTSLQSLRLEGCINLTSMVEKMHSLTSLTNSKSTTFLPSLEGLYLKDCPNLKGWWRGDVGEASNAQSPCFPCLSKLDIQCCPNLISMPLFPSVKEVYLSNTSGKPLQQTMRLKMTTSEAPSSSSSSPLILPFCKLENLVLHKIEDLDSLPDEFLQNLTSLRSLYIIGCRNLTSMPEGMRHLTSLTHLNIRACLQLSERCQRDIGVDWPNIAHIESIQLDGRWVQLEDARS